MMRKFFVLLIVYIMQLLMPFISAEVFPAPCAFADEPVKINSINFDNSDSIIFLGVSSVSEDAGVKITKKTLTDPQRVYFDIENAVMTFPANTFELQNSRLKQVKIAQNSLSPDIVRIVIQNSDDYDLSQINVLNIKNNIIIKLGAEKPLQQYLTQVYKETKDSAAEYYDKTVITPERSITEESPADDIFNSVQKAFQDEGEELVRPNIEQRQARLKSRFFLETAKPSNGGVLLGGIGVINVEKPFMLSNPSRIVFDLPNTVVLQELRDKEFPVSNSASVKIGQFEHSKARVVIKTNHPEAYKHFYGADLQTLLITKETEPQELLEAASDTELLSFKERSINSETNEINIVFQNPAVYSIKRENGRFKAVFYNLINFDCASFNAVSEKKKSGFNSYKTGSGAYVIEFPEDNNMLIDCYEALNASQLRFVTVKNPAASPAEKLQPAEPEKQESEKPEVKKPPKKFDFSINPLKPSARKQKKAEKILLQRINARPVVIDAGHGGNDTGALRGSVLEKDLTLQIALKVRDCLKDKGITNVIMTRSSDKTLTLDERVQISNDNNASMFVSVHINASVKSEINGIETHYYTENGYKAAKILHQELISGVDALDRGLFKSKFYVIKNTSAPAVLLELGFISNENERNALVSEQRQMCSAQAIADGIYKFLAEY